MALVANVFVPIGSTMAERFLYAPSLGFCIALVFTAWERVRLDRAQGGPSVRSPLLALVEGGQ